MTVAAVLVRVAAVLAVVIVVAVVAAAMWLTLNGLTR